MKTSAVLKQAVGAIKPISRKPALDTTNYVSSILPNGLRVVVASDPELQREVTMPTLFCWIYSYLYGRRRPWRSQWAK